MELSFEGLSSVGVEVLLSIGGCCCGETLLHRPRFSSASDDSSARVSESAAASLPAESDNEDALTSRVARADVAVGQPTAEAVLPIRWMPSGNEPDFRTSDDDDAEEEKQKSEEGDGWRRF